MHRKAQLAADAQVQHNALPTDAANPGLGRLRSPRAAALFMGMPLDGSRPAPHLGQHSREVLLELGRSPEEVDALVASGAVGAGGRVVMARAESG